MVRTHILTPSAAASTGVVVAQLIIGCIHLNTGLLYAQNRLFRFTVEPPKQRVIQILKEIKRNFS